LKNIQFLKSSKEMLGKTKKPAENRIKPKETKETLENNQKSY
jgi:hypothetical protein